MIKKCLFAAAGYGTRLLPATKTIPKEMLPIADKPLIQFGVQETINAGITDISFVTSQNKKALEDYFDKYNELENQLKGTPKEKLLEEINAIIKKCKFSFTRQNEMLGTGHAISTGQHLIGNQPFAVVFPDDICLGENNQLSILKEMVETHEKYKCTVILVEAVPPEEVSKYGIIKGEQIEEGIIKVSELVEKPSPETAPSNIAAIGKYILTPDIFEILKETKAGANNEIQLTDAIAEQVKKGQVIAYILKGKRFDCGSLDGFVKATNYFHELNKK